MTGVKLILIVTLFSCLNRNYGLAYIEKFSEQHMCNKTIALGTNGIYVAELDFDFLVKQEIRCWTRFLVPDAYTVAYRFLRASSIYRKCDTTLTISHTAGIKNYRFCASALFPRNDVILESHRNLMFNFSSTNDAGMYNIQLFMFKSDAICDPRSVRCKNGRCIDHALFCDVNYNFCGDDSLTGSCGTNFEPPETGDVTLDKINVIGPICLGLFVFLLIIVMAFLCCRSAPMRSLWGCGQRASRGQRSVPLTARDVYIINVGDVGGTPEEGYDYVMDYKKYAAPPEYSSLDNIADAAVRYASIEGGVSAEGGEHSTVAGVADGVDGTTEVDGNTNAGFVYPDEDELPNYDHVMRNVEEYNVNHNQL